MPTEYFEQRERALLGPRYEQLYAAPQEAAERGVTVSALRAMPEQFAQKADFPLEVLAFLQSGLCGACAGVQTRTPPVPPRGRVLLAGAVGVLGSPAAGSAARHAGTGPVRGPRRQEQPAGSGLARAGRAGEQRICGGPRRDPESNLERMGVPNAVVLNETPARIAEALPEFFDRVLVDAPCSGEGMFRKEPVARQQHCEALVKQCAELGAQILDCAAAALAPGGQLVYSTCTFAPEEDEGQVAAFLQRHPEFELADALGNVDYTFGSEGEANRTGGLPLDVRKVRRIWPCQGGEGHFMARLVKAGTPRTLPAAGEYTPEELLWLDAAAAAGKKGKGKGGKPAREQDARAARRADSRACRDAVQGGRSRSRDAGAGETTPAQSLAAWKEFAQEYFPALAGRSAVVHGGGVLLPVPFPQTGLHVLRAGVFVGSVQKGRFVPEHHLFTAFGAQCANREELTLADPRCVEYLSGREVEARTAADGWCCVTVDGWPLGGGKVSGGRVKNHYPKALRLL